jgi:hypothetical protein
LAKDTNATLLKAISLLVVQLHWRTSVASRYFQRDTRQMRLTVDARDDDCHCNRSCFALFAETNTPGQSTHNNILARLVSFRATYSPCHQWSLPLAQQEAELSTSERGFNYELLKQGSIDISSTIILRTLWSYSGRFLPELVQVHCRPTPAIHVRD